MKILYLISFLFFISTYGCGGSTAEYEEAKVKPIKKEQIINQSFEEVWQKVVDWLAYHNSPIKTLDKSSGFIASDYNLSVDETSKYIDCGKVISGQTNFQGTEVTKLRFENQKGNFNVLIKKIDDSSTKVIINFFSESELNQYDNSNGLRVYTQKVTCYSNGTLEKEIFDSISK